MTARPDRWPGRCYRHLSDEEVLRLAQSGSRSAVEHLLTRYRGFVEGKARTFFFSGAEHDDVVQEGMIGLYKAIRDYRDQRLVRFRAFAEICITRQIISALKSASRQKHLPLNRYIPIHAPVSDDGSPLWEILADSRTEEPEIRVLGLRLVEYLECHGRAELSELEHEVIRRRLEGKTYQQVARELKCGPKCVDNALQRAKRKIWSRLASWQQE